MAKQVEPKDRGTPHEQSNDLAYRYTEEERRRIAAGEDPSTIVREGRGRLEPLPLSAEEGQELRELPWKAGDVPTHYTDEERRRMEESAAAHRERYPLGPAIAQAARALPGLLGAETASGVTDNEGGAVWNINNILHQALAAVAKIRAAAGNVAEQVDTALGKMGIEPAVPRNQPQELPPVDSPPQRQGLPLVTPPEGAQGQTNMYGKMLDAANVGASVGMMSEGMAAIQAQRNNGRNTR